MTLVYERSIAGPQTHALVIGVGRFSNLSTPNANRQACPDSARAMIDLLIKHADALAAPLASIEVLISDPGMGGDRVPRGGQLTDKRPDDLVESATLIHTMSACARWRHRIKAGDSVFFYGCSHGVAGRDERALLVLEDAGGLDVKNWHELLDVECIAKYAAAALDAGSVWVFLDACQEVLPDLAQAVGGARAHSPISADVQQTTRCKVDALFLASSRVGRAAYAPPTGGVAYFTEALIAGLDRCLVEQHYMGWAVTGPMILFDIETVRQALGGSSIYPMSLSPFRQRTVFSVVSDPRVLVSVATKPSTLIRQAARVEAFDISNGGRHRVAVRTDAGLVWRFEINPSVSALEVEMDLGAGGVQTKTFTLKPPALVGVMG